MSDEAQAHDETLVTAREAVEELIRETTFFCGCVEALMRHTNPHLVNEGHGQQWFATSDCQQMRVEPALEKIREALDRAARKPQEAVSSPTAAACRSAARRASEALAWAKPIAEAPRPADPVPGGDAGRLQEAREAAMLSALEGLYELCTLGASDDAFKNGVTDSSGTIDEGDARASDRLCAARRAINSAPGATRSDRGGTDAAGQAGETFETIAQWCEETFGPIDLLRIATRAAEEMRELVETPNRVEEAADVLIVLSRYPGLWEAVERKMVVNRARRWQLMGDGTGYHVKDAAPPPPVSPAPVGIGVAEIDQILRDTIWLRYSERSGEDHYIDGYEQAAEAILARIAAPAVAGADDEIERCPACKEPLRDGQRVLDDFNNGGTYHRDCLGPDRESFTDGEGDPLPPDAPIPEGYVYRADPAVATERVRHVMHGAEYAVLHRGVEFRRSSPAVVGNDGTPLDIETRHLVIYQGDDGKLWAREESEFGDGRFVPTSSTPTVAAETFQARVMAHVNHVMADDSTDLAERRDRHAEEDAELLQALGMTREAHHRVVDYVHNRPVGEPAQEMGGTVHTLAALASYAGLDMLACGETELARCWTPEVVAKIKRKRANRHGRGPLPGDDADLVTSVRVPASTPVDREA